MERNKMLNWAAISNYPGYYASSQGHIWCERLDRELSQHVSGNYSYVKIGDNIGVHRLVAMAFHPESYEPHLVVNHKNSHTLDNRPENLEWVTDSENLLHSYENGRVGKRSVKQYDLDGNFVQEFSSIREAANFDLAMAKKIERSCNGSKVSGDFRWEYSEDKEEHPKSIIGWDIGNHIFSQDGRLFGKYYRKWLRLQESKTSRSVYDFRQNGRRVTYTPEQLFEIVSSMGEAQEIFVDKRNYLPNATTTTDTSSEKPKRGGKAKQVLQYDLEGNFITDFDSATAAAAAVGAHHSSVNRACRGQAKTCHGYIWKYAE